MLDDSCNVHQDAAGGFNAQLFQSSADCVKVLDAEGRVTHLNPGGVTALELDNPAFLLGKEWVQFWPAETKATVTRAIETALAGKKFQFAAFCPTSKGSERWWDVVVTPIVDDSQQVRQLMVVSRDVTELHLARIALQDANRRKDEFLALLSHELRNPLSAAGMGATVLQTQSHSLSQARVAEIGNLIQRQVAHMSRLAEDLLDVSRLTRGDVSLKMVPVNMKDVVRDVIEQLEPTYAAKRQEVHFKECAMSCNVLGDQTRLVQAVGNIVANSVRYTPLNGFIDIALACSADAVVLTVSDSGVGIAASELPTLFELYRRGDRSLAERKSGGLGIGLALVRSLVELHGGSVTAASEGAGMGSTFTIEIPASLRMAA